MAVLSFQSRVTWGHVGNAVAEFALRRIGCDCWPIDTVVFSNHPGYGRHAGRVTPAAEIVRLVDGLAEVGALSGCRAVLSGYLGSPDNGEAVLDAVARVKSRVPDAVWCCDPVMGDRDSGLYVHPDLARFFSRDAVAAADIMMPNHFELETLTGLPLPRLKDVVAAAYALRASGPSLVVVSSIEDAEATPGRIATLLASREGAWLVETPHRPLQAKGVGDLLAALFVGRWLATSDARDALEFAVAGTFAVIERTVTAPSSRELRLVAAQDDLVRPPTTFPAKRLG